jgi:hypothetical protein
MLGLAQEVSGAELAVHAVVRDHQGLGRTGEQVNAHPPEQLPLGLRHEGVAGTHEHVDRSNGLRPDGHGSDGLDSSKAVDFVCASKMLSCDDRGRRLAAVRWRTRDHALNACDLGRDHAHVRGGQEGVLPARHVAASGINRNVLVTKDHARQRFTFDIKHRISLDLSEVTHLSLGKCDVVEVSLAQLRKAILNVPVRKLEAFPIPIVEADGKLANGSVPRCSMSERIVSTVDRTLASAAAATPSSMPCFKIFAMTTSQDRIADRRAIRLSGNDFECKGQAQRHE